MLQIHPQYITDSTGKKLSVVLRLEEFQAIVESLELVEDIRLYDEVKEAKEEAIPIDEAFKMIEEKRKKG